MLDLSLLEQVDFNSLPGEEYTYTPTFMDTVFDKPQNILLVAIGCVFLVAVLLALWKRRAKIVGRLLPLFSFSFEWTWRFFLVLQGFGLLRVVYLMSGDLSIADLLDVDRYFDNYHGYSRRQNWLVLAYLFGPFLLAKSIDWIYSAKKSTSAPMPAGEHDKEP